MSQRKPEWESMLCNGRSSSDYNNDGWRDLYVTCLGGNVLYRNDGEYNFTDVSYDAGVALPSMPYVNPSHDGT